MSERNYTNLSKQRSLKHQFNYACTEHCRMGYSKHAEKNNPNFDNKGYVYSIKYAESLRDTITNFANFMAKEYPEVKQIKDITTEHTTAWVMAHQDNWSSRTTANHISKLKVLQSQVQDTFKSCHNDFSSITLPERIKAENIRTIAMSENDFNLLSENMQARRTPAKEMILITRYAGMRADEAAHLHRNNIDLENKCLHIVEGAKNGRKRDVPIRDIHISYFADLKANSVDYVCHGVKVDSLNRAVRRAMKEITLEDGQNMSDKYKATTDHSIRKLYARERMQEEREKGFGELEAWNRVCAELGHGKNRKDLYAVYVGGKI